MSSTREINEECKERIKLEKLAAFVDGEGSIIINKRIRINGKISYVQQIQIGNTDMRLIEWLIENFGGIMPKPYAGSGNRKVSYIWSLTSSNSYKLINKIRPYLLLKQEQADNAIELYEKVTKWHYTSTKPMPKHKRELAERIWKRNRKLNMRGKLEESDEPKLVRREVRTLEEFV